MKYNIEETPCFPNKWKIVPEKPFREDNSFVNFFETKEEAERELEKREERTC